MWPLRCLIYKVSAVIPWSNRRSEPRNSQRSKGGKGKGVRLKETWPTDGTAAGGQRRHVHFSTARVSLWKLPIARSGVLHGRGKVTARVGGDSSGARARRGWLFAIQRGLFRMGRACRAGWAREGRGEVRLQPITGRRALHEMDIRASRHCSVAISWQGRRTPAGVGVFHFKKSPGPRLGLLSFCVCVCGFLFYWYRQLAT